MSSKGKLTELGIESIILLMVTLFIFFILIKRSPLTESTSFMEGLLEFIHTLHEIPYLGVFSGGELIFLMIGFFAVFSSFTFILLMGFDIAHDSSGPVMMAVLTMAFTMAAFLLMNSETLIRYFRYFTVIFGVILALTGAYRVGYGNGTMFSPFHIIMNALYLATVLISLGISPTSPASILLALILSYNFIDAFAELVDIYGEPRGNVGEEAFSALIIFLFFLALSVAVLLPLVYPEEDRLLNLVTLIAWILGWISRVSSSLHDLLVGPNFP